ncbi:GTP-binding protein [Hypoxylon argillaceum]|nr:GTP-binding protein [Hypoxylon argillaceum]
MASVFTFPYDPPRVSSPWRSGQDSGKRPSNERCVSTGAIGDLEQTSDSEVERLEAEPQDGPIEYKLHLLLRPRRPFKAMSTAIASKRSRANRKPNEAGLDVPLASSNHSRQHRLQHLTTQLLWRLKQSSPDHATARGDLVIPTLPEDNAELAILQEPGQLLPGLEESNGALYEIGVADDGTFIGLIKEEMDESMKTLKVMAASLGCRVEVQRMKAVGTADWLEDPENPHSQLRHEDLWVAEALIVPILDGQSKAIVDDNLAPNGVPRRGASTVEQLRVSLIGPTTSGKTTLLGTLANGTLDDGRGRSRSYLLRHRHEVASGRTSSVAQELVGYEGQTIFNYTCMDIKAWPDIHDRAQDGRLVFLLDSAGHPRYQRTTLRALVGWAPHWTFLCIAASEENTISTGTHSLTGAEGALGIGIAELDLATAHLDLCLKLEIPLAILITKIEKAQRTLLKEKLNNIFTKVKATGRIPKLITSSGPLAADLSEVPKQDQAKVQTEVIDAIARAASNSLAVVPILLTSAVTGAGIGLTHALLASLPVPPVPTAQDFVPRALNPEQPTALFHIDEVFELARSRAQSTLDQTFNESAPVVTGYLRFGRLSIGDQVVIGPFPADDEDAGLLIPNDHPSLGYGLSIPHPLSAEYARLSARNALSASKIEGEWRNATIVNIRELRLPVQSIEAGQAGSIQVVLDTLHPDAEEVAEKQSSIAPRIRKGQVLAMPSRHMIETGLTLQASTGFKASFMTPDIQSLTVGSLINAYIGMVRAAVRVLRITRQRSRFDSRRVASEDNDDIFSMSDHVELERTKSAADLDLYNTEYHVALELLSNREWIELGSRVVLIEGGFKDKSGGFDGFVGKVIEVVE